MPPDDGRPTVLLVDADERTREHLRTHEEWADAAVEPVDGDGARASLADGGHDAVVVDPATLDVAVPAFVETVREHHPDVPVVVYTAVPHDDLPDDTRASVDSLVEKGDLDDSAAFLRRKLAGLGAAGGDGPGPLESYEVLVEAARDGIYVLDAGGTFRYLNESLASMLGYGREELVGAHASTVMAPGELESGQAVVQSVLEGDDDESEVYDMKLMTAAGEPLVVATHFTVVTDEAGAYGGIVGVMRDVTERRRHERELERQRQRLEEFTGIVAHDLRNPVAAAQANLEAYRATGEASLVDDALSAVDRMETLIDDLLALAQVGDATGDARVVDVGRAAEAAFDRVDAPDARLRLDGPGAVRADEDRLVQLLENLLGNAVDHAGPEVTVTVGALDGAGRGFYVADDGPGIPEDERERVLEHGVTTSEDGTGFGLSIVRTIAEAHGWSLGISESDAGGARFEIGADEAEPVF